MGRRREIDWACCWVPGGLGASRGGVKHDVQNARIANVVQDEILNVLPRFGVHDGTVGGGYVHVPFAPTEISCVLPAQNTTRLHLTWEVTLVTHRISGEIIALALLIGGHALNRDRVLVRGVRWERPVFGSKSGA